jgi:hypothetical protein
LRIKEKVMNLKEIKEIKENNELVCGDYTEKVINWLITKVEDLEKDNDVIYKDYCDAVRLLYEANDKLFNLTGE